MFLNGVSVLLKFLMRRVVLVVSKTLSAQQVPKKLLSSGIMNENRKFNYTKNNKALSNQQREFYEENGYILIKNNVSHGLLDELSQYFIDICDCKIQATGLLSKDRSLKTKGYKGQNEVQKFQDFLNDDTLFKYASYGPVTDVVESIIGPNILGVHSMLINKPPDSHPDISRHPLHQDLYYFPFRPTNSIVASWTAMETINELNGCLYVVPGSHKSGVLHPHSYPDGMQNALYHGIIGLDDEVKVNLVMDKGDTVFFHPLLLHGSGPNLTKGFRKAISVHYADSNCYFIDVKGTVQEKIMTEVESIFEDINYMVLWRIKARHVKGKPGNYMNIQSNL